MPLAKARFILSVEWPEGHDERYYWQHCSWVKTEDYTNNFQMALDVDNRHSILYTTQVLKHGVRFYWPTDNTPFWESIYAVAFPCDLPAQENYDILIAARWRMWGADDSYTYHLHRQPLGEDLIENGQFTPDGYLNQTARLNTFMGSGEFYTHTGSQITRGEVVTTPSYWQLRHGTKRRSRRFGVTT